jgi:hypothetical protein
VAELNKSSTDCTAPSCNGSTPHTSANLRKVAGFGLKAISGINGRNLVRPNTLAPLLVKLTR